MMLLAALAALVALAEPAAPPPTADEPKVTGVEPATAVEPAVPSVSATQSPAPTAPVVPPLPPAAPAPSPQPAEAVDETDSPRPPSPPPVRPAAAFGFEMGYARGGDRFFAVVSPTSIPASANAGDGVFFALAGNWMPYWSERGIGLGVYARAGAKYAAVGNSTASASFLRCPLALGVQVLLPIFGRWFALGRFGVLTEVLGQLAFASNGVSGSSTNFSSGWANSSTRDSTGRLQQPRASRRSPATNGSTFRITAAP